MSEPTRRFMFETADEDDDLNFCPMGCGGRTEDAAGGPCQACWALAETTPEWTI